MHAIETTGHETNMLALRHCREKVIVNCKPLLNRWTNQELKVANNKEKNTQIVKVTWTAIKIWKGTDATKKISLRDEKYVLGAGDRSLYQDLSCYVHAHWSSVTRKMARRTHRLRLHSKLWRHQFHYLLVYHLARSLARRENPSSSTPHCAAFLSPILLAMAGRGGRWSCCDHYLRRRKVRAWRGWIEEGDRTCRPLKGGRWLMQRRGKVKRTGDERQSRNWRGRREERRGWGGGGKRGRLSRPARAWQPFWSGWRSAVFLLSSCSWYIITCDVTFCCHVLFVTSFSFRFFLCSPSVCVMFCSFLLPIKEAFRLCITFSLIRLGVQSGWHVGHVPSGSFWNQTCVVRRNQVVIRDMAGFNQVRRINKLGITVLLKLDFRIHETMTVNFSCARFA